MTELLALYREAEFSPGQHKSNDSRLLELLADRLRDHGFAVQLATFDQAPLLIPNVDTVLSMCQGKAALEQLTVWENQGKQIINRPQAARNTYRDRLSEVMVGAGVSFAGTELISTNGEKPHRGLTVEGSVWLKRGDVHASIPADG